MTLTLNLVRNIILALVVLLFLSTFFSVVSFLAAEQAQAQIPVTDVVSIASGWAMKALDKAWDLVKFAAGKVWDFTLAKLEDTWKFLRENAIAVLISAAVKIAVRYLLAEYQKLAATTKIESYLYYSEFLIRSVYTLEYIGKNFEGDKQNQMILLSLINDGDTLYKRLNPGTTAYEGIKAATLLNPACQTRNLNPQAPDYYIRLLQSKGPECIPQFVVAGYRDQAMMALNEARRAADQEIQSGMGIKSGRSCGVVATENFYNVVSNKDGAIGDTRYTRSDVSGINQDNPNNNIQFVRGGEQVAVLPSVANAICGIITYPASQAASLMNSMVDRIIALQLDPKGDSRSTTQLRNHLSDALVSVLPKMFGFEGSVPTFDSRGRTTLANTNRETDYRHLLDLIPPGIDANRQDGDLDDSDLGNLSLGAQNRRLDSYWDNFCTERLPLLFAWSNGNYPGQAPGAGGDNGSGSIYPLTIGNLRLGRIAPKTGAGVHAYLPARPQLISNFGSSTSDILDIDKMLKQEFSPHFVQTTSEDSGSQYGSANFNRTTYKYIWQIHEDKRDHTDTGFDDELAVARRYWMSRYAFPTSDDVKASHDWIPSVWPYWADSRGIGYILPSQGVGAAKEGYRDLGAARLYTVTETGATQAVATNNVFEAANRDLIFSTTNSLSGVTPPEMYKLNRTLSVVVNNGVVVTNPNSFRSTGGEAYFVEYTENGVSKFVAAEKLTKQTPCGQQPYGPPVNLRDIGPKIEYTRSISVPLWEWVMEELFLKEQKQQGL